MKNFSQVALTFLSVFAANSAFAQCAPGSPCAMRSGAPTYNSQYERPYGAPDYRGYSEENSGYYQNPNYSYQYSESNPGNYQYNPNMNSDMRNNLNNPDALPNMNKGYNSTSQNPNNLPKMNPGLRYNP